MYKVKDRLGREVVMAWQAGRILIIFSPSTHRTMLLKFPTVHYTICVYMCVCVCEKVCVCGWVGYSVVYIRTRRLQFGWRTRR